MAAEYECFHCWTHASFVCLCAKGEHLREKLVNVFGSQVIADKAVADGYREWYLFTPDPKKAARQ